LAAVEHDPAAERLDAVLQAGQARAAGEVGAADSIVLDRDAQDADSNVDSDCDD
jgi:hypothetical protein